MSGQLLWSNIIHQSAAADLHEAVCAEQRHPRESVKKLESSVTNAKWKTYANVLGYDEIKTAEGERGVPGGFKGQTCGASSEWLRT